MAKGNPRFAYDRQDQTIHQFQKDLRSADRRNWLTITEQCILNGATKRTTPVEKPRISHYNPNNPLNGSSSWTREQWNFYKQTGKSPIKK